MRILRAVEEEETPWAAGAKALAVDAKRPRRAIDFIIIVVLVIYSAIGMMSE